MEQLGTNVEELRATVEKLPPQVLSDAVHSPLQEVAVGLALLVAVIMIHGVGMRVIARRFNLYWSQVDVGTPRWKLDLILALVVGSLAATHLVETLIFAAPLVALDILPNPRDAYYYVLESYTTLGEATVSLPEQWRLLGPIIAMTGLFTFGWTGSTLVAVVTQFNRIDRAQARVEIQDKKAADKAMDAGDVDAGKAGEAGKTPDPGGGPAA